MSFSRKLILAGTVLGVAAIAWASAASSRTAVPLFSGAQIRDFPIEYSARGAITEVPDPAGSGETVLKLTVSNHDVYPLTPTDNPRAELLSPSFVRGGMNLWLSTKFLVPRSYPAIRPGGWVSLVSFYGPPFYGSSPFQLELGRDSLQWQRNRTYRYDIPFRMPLVRGRWTTVLVHELFAGHGFVELWIDGRPVTFFGPDGGWNPGHHRPTRRLEMATRDRSNDRGPNSARIMQYRERGMFKRGTIYFGALDLGPTRASVE